MIELPPDVGVFAVACDATGQWSVLAPVTHELSGRYGIRRVGAALNPNGVPHRRLPMPASASTTLPPCRSAELDREIAARRRGPSTQSPGCSAVELDREVEARRLNSDPILTVSRYSERSVGSSWPLQQPDLDPLFGRPIRWPIPFSDVRKLLSNPLLTVLTTSYSAATVGWTIGFRTTRHLCP